MDAVWKTIHDEMVELLKGHDSVRWDLSNPLSPLAKVASGPTVILVAGVNGVGKTTSIAKLANLLQKTATKSFSQQAIPSARLRWSSSRYGANALAARLSARKAIPILRRSRMMASRKL